MSFDLWIAFVIASTIVLTIPGPTIMLVVGYVLGHGSRTAFATVPGVALGDFTALTLSLVGIGALLAASAFWFTVFKFVGAAYLIWLGIKLWRAKARARENTEAVRNYKTQWVLFRDSYIVTTLNPKTIAFFVAFVPQFIDPSAPILMQLVVLEITFLVLATLNIILWVIFAAKLRNTFRQPYMLKFFNRLGGSFMIGAGVFTATSRAG